MGVLLIFSTVCFNVLHSMQLVVPHVLFNRKTNLHLWNNISQGQVQIP